DRGPRLVWADWLDERGDRRGAWSRHWCRLEEAALAVPFPAPPTDVAGREAGLAGYPGHPGPLSGGLSRPTPPARGRGVRDLPAGARAPRPARPAAYSLAAFSTRTSTGGRSGRCSARRGGRRPNGIGRGERPDAAGGEGRGRPT